MTATFKCSALYLLKILTFSRSDKFESGATVLLSRSESIKTNAKQQKWIDNAVRDNNLDYE